VVAESGELDVDVVVHGGGEPGGEVEPEEGVEDPSDAGVAGGDVVPGSVRGACRGRYGQLTLAFV
jgi:hypothetical protein